MTVRVRINKFFGNYSGANAYLQEYLRTLKKVSNANSARNSQFVKEFKAHIRPHVHLTNAQVHSIASGKKLGRSLSRFRSSAYSARG